MLAIGDWLGVLEGVGTLVGEGKPVGVEDGSGIAHPASRTQSRAAANVLIDRQTVHGPRWLRQGNSSTACASEGVVWRTSLNDSDRPLAGLR